jgi:hypothetical protein
VKSVAGRIRIAGTGLCKCIRLTRCGSYQPAGLSECSLNVLSFRAGMCCAKINGSTAFLMEWTPEILD